MEESEYLNPNAFLQFPLKDVDDQPWVSLSPVSENSSPMNSYSATLSPVESNLIFCDHVNLDAFEPNESLLFDLPEPGETLKTEEEIVVFDPIESEPMDGSTVIQDEDEEELYPEQERNPLEYTRNENGELEIPIRLSRRPTVYEIFGRNRIDWCRYCGVTQKAQTAAFRPGPWGKRTLCNKHGCDYKGYGYIEKEPRLNLAPFIGESVKERIRPILQDWCAKCFQHHSIEHNVLVQCDGCCRAYHQMCHEHGIPDDIAQGYTKDKWYCDPQCRENVITGKIAIEVPKRNLPLMKSAARPNIYQGKTTCSTSVYASTNPSLLAQEALTSLQKRKTKKEDKKCLVRQDIPQKTEIITPDWTKLEKTSHPRVKRQCTQKRGSPALLKEVKPASEEYEDMSNAAFEERHAHFEQMEQRR